MDSGYDRYLKYQFRQLGKFYTALFDAITYADEVDAFKIWTRVGADELIAKCSPTYQQKIKSGEWVV